MAGFRINSLIEKKIQSEKQVRKLYAHTIPSRIFIVIVGPVERLGRLVVLVLLDLLPIHCYKAGISSPYQIDLIWRLHQMLLNSI